MTKSLSVIVNWTHGLSSCVKSKGEQSIMPWQAQYFRSWNSLININIKCKTMIIDNEQLFELFEHVESSFWVKNKNFSSKNPSLKFADFAYLFLLFLLLYQEIYFYLYEFDTLMWLSLGFYALKLSCDFEKVQRIVFIYFLLIH